MGAQFQPTFVPSDVKDSFLKGYLVCAEWLMSDEDDEEAPEPQGFSTDALADAKAECEAFEAANEELLAEYYEEYSPSHGYSVFECGGHDFFLSRNGHGSGFFDRGDAPCFDRLQEAARACGESSLYVGDDGFLYFG